MPKPQQIVLKNGRVVHFVRKFDFDTVSREIFDEGAYRKHGIQLRDDDYVFDIGANVGLFIVDISQRVKRATVYAFEPIPDLFAAREREHESQSDADSSRRERRIGNGRI